MSVVQAAGVVWLHSASLGFPRLHSSATALNEHKCSSMSCRLFNLLVLSGFTRLPLASLKCNSVKATQMLKLLTRVVQSAGVVRLHSASLEEQNVETGQALNLLMCCLGRSEQDREAHVERYGGCMLCAKLCVARRVMRARCCLRCCA